MCIWSKLDSSGFGTDSHKLGGNEKICFRNMVCTLSNGALYVAQVSSYVSPELEILAFGMHPLHAPLL